MFWNSYVLKLLRLETLTFSDVTLSDINVVWCYVLSQYRISIYSFLGLSTIPATLGKGGSDCIYNSVVQSSAKPNQMISEFAGCALAAPPNLTGWNVPPFRRGILVPGDLQLDNSGSLPEYLLSSGSRHQKENTEHNTWAYKKRCREGTQNITPVCRERTQNITPETRKNVSRDNWKHNTRD